MLPFAGMSASGVHKSSKTITEPKHQEYDDKLIINSETVSKKEKSTKILVVYYEYK